MSVPSWSRLIADLRILQVDREYDTLGRVKTKKRLRSDINFRKELGYGQSQEHDDGSGRKVHRKD
jgi:hypothetical protein